MIILKSCHFINLFTFYLFNSITLNERIQYFEYEFKNELSNKSN